MKYYVTEPNYNGQRDLVYIHNGITYKLLEGVGIEPLHKRPAAIFDGKKTRELPSDWMEITPEDKYLYEI